MVKMATAAPATIAAQTEMKRKKKKGRPSLSDLNERDNSTPPRRSTRQNPNPNSNSPPPDFDDDDERKEKKVKLVVRLPQSNQQESSSGNSLPDSGGDNHEASVKRRKIDSVDPRSDDAVADQVLKFGVASGVYCYFSKSKFVSLNQCVSIFEIFGYFFLGFM